MRMIVGLRPLIVCSSFLGAACLGTFSRVHRSETQFRPNEAEVRIQNAFRALGIPIVEEHMDGRVRSGEFDPYLAFGSSWADRISCGNHLAEGPDEGVRPVRLEVLVTIRSSGQRGTRVETESYGVARGPDGEEVGCRLSDEAQATLRDAVAQGRGFLIASGS